jgi:RHS repeat-associated protein
VRPHAVTASNNGTVTTSDDNIYGYDNNGNQITRVIGADTFNLKYNAENQLVEVKKNSVVMATFAYDGDGRQVKATVNGVTTLYVGGHYEVKGNEISKYYFAGAARIAMRRYVIPQSMTLEYLLSDHLGSTSLVTDSAGALVSEARYKPWGEVRYTKDNAPLPTLYTYTGQRSDSYINLLWYGSRYFDATLGRFISPDTIVPLATQGTQALDRYAYANNNAVRYNDPTGHCILCITAAVVGGVVLGTAIYSHVIHQPSKPTDANASTAQELLYLGYEHAEHANITGDALQSIQDDRSVQAAQQKVIESIAGNSKYGEEPFFIQKSDPKEFTANGPTGNWVQALVDGNQAFWTVHSSSITATNTTVSADGTISATWHIQDDFDFIPGPNHALPYNIWASLVHPIYNGIFAAKESFPIDVYWNQTHPPQKKESSPE